MMTENPKVYAIVKCEDDRFWVDTVINGYNLDIGIPVKSIEDGDIISARLEALVAEAYRRGYRSGFSNCQNIIKETLGIKS